MKIAVCDDEKVFRDEVTEALYEFFGRLELTCEAFEHGGQLLSAFAGGKSFDAVFLDIEMPVLDGMKTAESLRENGYEGPILFLTSHTERAMEGYEVGAFRFLAKPVDRDKAYRAFGSLREELTEKKRLLIRYEGEDVVLLLEDIRYIEAMNNSISVVTSGGGYRIRKKLSDMEKELAALSDCFVKIHRCYIVNLFHVKKMHGTEVIVTGDTALPVSRGAVNAFRQRLFQYVKDSAG